MSDLKVDIEQSWQRELKSEFQKDYFQELVQFVKDEYETETVYPPGPLIFNAFDHCSFEEVRVVIIGQDPYHGPGQANGLAFSVRPDLKIPPSLQNIYKEIEADLGRKTINQDPKGNVIGDLTNWAEQGVLLLNATLTVRKRDAGSHQGHGWERFTDSVIEKLNQEKDKLVFMLWGKFAQQKGQIVDESRHLVLKSPHPSPFSAHRGFFGANHFSKANEYLKEHGFDPIAW
jgi:uracil-DNA glycosylase